MFVGTYTRDITVVISQSSNMRTQKKIKASNTSSSLQKCIFWQYFKIWILISGKWWKITNPDTGYMILVIYRSCDMSECACLSLSVSMWRPIFPLKRSQQQFTFAGSLRASESRRQAVCLRRQCVGGWRNAASLHTCRALTLTSAPSAAPATTAPTLQWRREGAMPQHVLGETGEKSAQRDWQYEMESGW